jgi:protease IV
MKKYFFGLFSGIVLVIILIVAGFAALLSNLAGDTAVKSDNSVMLLKWGDLLPGHGLSPMDANLNAPLTLTTVRESIINAANDPAVKAILIDGRAPMRGEHVLELASALEVFQANGKQILAHLDSGSDNSYMLASLADRISLSPSAAGGLMLFGPRLENYYMRDALDKLGIKVNVVHVGEAKGFGERYSRQDMSTPVKENLSLLINDLFSESLEWISANRNTKKDDLKAAITAENRLSFLPEEVLEMGLVDFLETRSEWKDYIDSEFDNPDWISPADLLSPSQPFGPSARPVGCFQPHIAVLWAEGAIYPGSIRESSGRINSTKLIKNIRDLAEDDNVKAMIFRIESPGGSALASEEIYQELLAFSQIKPLIASMGTVAASGGYYIAAPAKEIWLSPFSVTGSIGVVSTIPDVSGAAGKLGINTEGIYLTEFSRFFALGKPVQEKHLQLFQAKMAVIYKEFKQRVLAHRPLDENSLEAVAGGKVWSGRRAIELGLADKIGGLDAVIASTRKSMDSAEMPTVNYPLPMTLFDMISQGNFSPRDFIPSADLGEMLAGSGFDDPVIESCLKQLSGGKAIENIEELHLRTQWLWSIE